MSERDTAGRAGDSDLLGRLNEVLEGAGLYLAAELRDGLLMLSGEVDSDENRQAALDIAHALAGPRGLAVDDAIDVLPTAPDNAFSEGDEARGRRYGYVDADVDNDSELDPGMEHEPDFAGDPGTTDFQESVEEGETYFPPTDPVVRPVDDPDSGDLEVVGGMQETSMDHEETAAGFDDRDDSDVEDDVLRELREDALTTDLRINIKARNGIVTLRGAVETLDDAENAEAVASRVSGVREVREELDVVSLQNS